MDDLQALLAGLPARIDGIVERQAQASPESPALREAGCAISFAQLAQAAGDLAARLAELGVRAGDRLLIVGENSIAQAAAIFAASKLDAWATPVNARLSARELDTIRAHCRPRRVLYTHRISDEAAAHAARHGAAEHHFDHIGPLMLSALDEDCTPEPVFAAPQDQVAELLYTSGTTGDPKGVMLTHRNACFIACVSARLRELTPADHVYGVLPTSHVFGLNSVLLGTLSAGACLTLAPRFSAEKTAHALAHEGITVMQGVPAMYARLLELAKAGAIARASPALRFLYAGGAPLGQSLKDEVEAAYGCPLHNGYGMTESAPTISQTRPSAPRRDCSVGRPIPHVAVRIVDAQGRDVAAGAVGKLWVRGPNVMKGYFRNPALTAEVVDPAGWLNTGDLARQDADGALFIVGRSKELIIRSGFNVYPVEVEAVLNSHPAVTQSAVVGRAVPGNEEVVAFVELQPGAAVSTDELAAWAAERLTAYKRPAEIRVMAQLPAASTGKVLKQRLKELARTSGG